MTWSLMRRGAIAAPEMALFCWISAAYIFITGPAPQHTRRCYVITIENGTLLVSLIGRFGDVPPTDKQGFLAFADELHSDLAYRIITEAEQLSPIEHHRFVKSVQRHYEQMNSFPDRFWRLAGVLWSR